MRPTGPAVARAYARIEKFATEQWQGRFPKIDRHFVAEGVLKRVRNPKLVNQGTGWWCGPAAFIYSLARQDPDAYAKFVFDLYDNGTAFTAGGGLIQPSLDFRMDSVPIGEDSADWIALGSLRDSTNWIFEYHRNTYFERMEHIRGGTSTRDMEKWFKEFGFREVINKTSSSTCDLDNLKLAESYARRNYRVVLFIDAIVIQGGNKEAKAGGAADHFVALVGPIDYGPPIKMSVYTWGHTETIPGVSMAPDEFLHSYHGFVAARR